MSTRAPKRRPGAIAPDGSAKPADPARFEIVIPDWHPTRLNELIGRNRFVIGRRKKQDREFLAVYCELANIPPAAGKRRLTLKITLGPRQRAADPDAYWKSLLDALVHCKALKSDDRFGVESLPVEYDRAKSKRTVIVLEDMA